MKIVWRGSALIVLVVALYYFFFRPYEFKASFETKTLPGDIIQTIRIWNRSLDSAQIVEVDSFKRVRQRIFLGDREYLYDWYFQSDDSVTKVSVQISEPAHKLMNKMMVLIGEPPVKKDGTSTARIFYTVLKQHLEITKVKVIGEERHQAEFCLCRSLEKDQFNKAQGMMENYLPMSSFIEANGLRLSGLPSVRINEWSHSQGKLKYDFCFPILETDSLPVIEGLEYKRFNEFYALKAEYHGNFITSDRAWYELYQYASNSGYTTNGLPVEYFVDNPNFGTKEINWKAEIFLPVEGK